MTVLRLAAEFLCWPLWVEPEDDIAHNTEPASLPISRTLAQAIADWGDAYDLTLDQDYPPWSGFPDEPTAALWLQRGAELACGLEQEIARSGLPYTVSYGHAGCLPSAFVREHSLPAPEEPDGFGPR